MICLAAAFANAFMCRHRKDKLISLPAIAVTLATFVVLWNSLPKFVAGGLASITNYKSHDLASAATHDSPKPAFVPFFIDKWPHFIGFQYIFGLSWHQRIFKLGIGFVFFLSRKPEWDDWHRKCVVLLAYLSVHCRLIISVLSELQCIHVSVQEHRFFCSPCIGIADCHWRYDRFLRGFGYHNFDICIWQVLQSCLHYTLNHFNLTTTQSIIVIYPSWSVTYWVWHMCL